ncbi:TPA: ead/Ea22-like family protein [Salmonella enterica subsp. houtenae serovar Rough:z4,z23:-]
MTSREKFEAWYLENWGHTEDDHETLFERDPDSDEEYYRLGVRIAHESWQASESASQQKLTDMAVQLANAESKCRELAAENAGLKNPDNWLSQSDYGYEAAEAATQNGATEDESLRAGMVAIINRIETPATDAFLAEVRAQGVESGINTVIAMMNHQHPATSQAIDILQTHAAQLRKGAAL